MSLTKKSFAVALVGLLLSGPVALAQAGGADVPTDAKKEGAKENGASSTGVKSDGSQNQTGDADRAGSAEKK